MISPDHRCGAVIWFMTHYSDVIMSTVASQITGVSMICPTVSSGADQRKHQSSASLSFVVGIHRWPLNSPHKGPVTQKTFPFDDVIMTNHVACPSPWHTIHGFIKQLENWFKELAKLNETPRHIGINGKIWVDKKIFLDWLAILGLKILDNEQKS